MLFQLGISSVGELGQALGTVADVPIKQHVGEDQFKDIGFGDSKSTSEETNALVYTDSSTFLKVCSLLQFQKLNEMENLILIVKLEKLPPVWLMTLVYMGLCL